MSAHTSAEVRLIERRRVEANGCWTYVGRTVYGYGQITVDYIDRGVHRVAYELWVGPIPDGATLDHLCHTNDATCKGGITCLHRRCFNPSHLEPASAVENMLRGNSPSAVNKRRTHCTHGHEFTAENTTYYRGKSGTEHRQCSTCAKARAKAHRERKAVTA